MRARQMGQGSLCFFTSSAHDRHRQRCPHGTKQVLTLASMHTLHMLSLDSANNVTFGCAQHSLVLPSVSFLFVPDRELSFSISFSLSLPFLDISFSFLVFVSLSLLSSSLASLGSGLEVVVVVVLVVVLLLLLPLLLLPLLLLFLTSPFVKASHVTSQAYTAESDHVPTSRSNAVVVASLGVVLIL
jgi:hypothetical protein